MIIRLTYHSNIVVASDYQTDVSYHAVVASDYQTDASYTVVAGDY